MSPSGNDRWIVGEIRPLARLAATRSVADLLAVGLHLRRRPLVLARLDVGQDITEPLVLGDRRMRHPLVLVEYPVGQGMAFPPHIEPAVGIGVGLDIATDQPARHLGLLKHDPLALERKRQLRTDVALLAFAQDLLEPIRGKIQRPVQIIRSGRGNGKLPVIALHEPRQEGVAVVHATDAPGADP